MITGELDLTLVQRAAQQFIQKPFCLERVQSGVSTYVYRVVCDDETLYLRVLPEDASFAAEATAHRAMRALGVKAPEPLYCEPKNTLLGKSVLLTSEIPGGPVQNADPGAAGILFEAGRQLALINSIPVDGFGWIDRRYPHTLKGEQRTFRDYYYENLTADIDSLQGYGFDCDAIVSITNRAFTVLDTGSAYLAHGDFDTSHIFQQNGRYTGIIDFGEIRGSHRLNDLGHYRLHDDNGSFQDLLAGYRTVIPISEDDITKIDYLALFVGLGRCKYEHYRMFVKRHLDGFAEKR